MTDRLATRTRPAARLGWRSVVVAGLCGLSGCASTIIVPASDVALSAEQLEFRNMRPANRVPKSTGSALVRAFEQYCLGPRRNAASVAAALRRSDYVAAPRRQGDAMTSFVVDNRRPLVQVSDDGRFCAVVAEARTGQSARIGRMVALRFPDARRVATGETAQTADEFTIRVTNPEPALVALRRRFPAEPRPQLTLAIQYDR